MFLEMLWGFFSFSNVHFVLDLSKPEETQDCNSSLSALRFQCFFVLSTQLNETQLYLAGFSILCFVKEGTGTQLLLSLS